MREILELLRRIREHTDRVHELRVYGDGTWSVTDEKRTRVCENVSKRCDDPTADIIAALKAKLPPTKDEAVAALDTFIYYTSCPSLMAQNTHLQTVRRYLEAQKE
jgi:hypothetical protein